MAKVNQPQYPHPEAQVKKEEQFITYPKDKENHVRKMAIHAHHKAVVAHRNVVKNAESPYTR